MKKPLLLTVVVLIAIIAVASAAGAYYLTLPKNETPPTTPTPAPTSTLNPTSIPTPTSTATVTAAPTTRPTSTPQPTSNPTATNPPTATASPTPTPTPSPTASPTPTASPSPTPTASPSPTPTASPTPTPSPTPIPIGYARSNPAPTGTTLTTQFTYISGIYNAKVTVLELVRGTEAWTQIHAANMYNSAPTTGNEYILVKIHFEYLSGPTADTSYTVSQYNFYPISENGLQYASQTVVTPTPRFDAALYPNSSTEGWAAYQVALTDTHPLLAFARNYDGTGGIWFKLY
jgi:hypothetical protein